MNWNEQGGCAFPLGPSEQNDVDFGMSLRDWFAGQALGGLLSGRYAETTVHNLGEVPDEAYRIADAMLDARSIK